MPKISVVIPVYNVEEYLKKCVDSVLSQTETDFECILVNDGSTDNSGALCDEIAKQDSRIRVIHQENTGLGGARNTGIREAKSDWLLFIDSDDYIEPQTLDLTLKEAEKTDADMVIFAIRSVNDAGKQLAVLNDSVEHRRVYSPQKDTFLLKGMVTACNRICKKSLFTDFNIYFPSKVWYEDIRTTTKLLAHSKQVVYIENVLYNYLMREGSITKNVNADRNSEILEAFEDILSYFKANKLYEIYRDELCFLTIFHLYITASVRVLMVDPKHSLLGKFSDYMKKNFPTYRSCKYLFELDRNKKLILTLLEKKMYRTIRLLFKIKSGV